MRIVILGPAYPFRGGIAVASERLARSLQPHSVRLYTFTTQYPRWLFPGKSQFRTEPPPTDLEIYRRIHSLNPLSWWHTAREIRQWMPDIVLAKFWIPVMGLSFATILHYLPAVPVKIAILHNLLPHEARPGDTLFTRYFISEVDGAIALSAAVAKEWRDITSKPVKVLFHPVYDHYGEKVSKQEACATLGLDPHYRYLLFFGLIRRYKGLDLLLHAWRSEKLRQFSNVRLLIAGELYEPYEKYRPLLEDALIRDRIIFHEGFVPEERVRYYFCAADAVVQPYLSATQSGITQIAYHFEKPMVVTRVGGLPEMVPDKEVGFVCEPTVASLTEALGALLTTPLEQFIPSIRQAKSRLSWTAFRDELLEFAESLRPLRRRV
ncbi:MAG: glycosyltransferase [Bacteroidia bacterium]|nr:glycosyltransferase [Bacteroidia bacterium]MDW8015633.1 glycosyltransferase [Bacteroidia bacterium]